jgi:hypothetical protein
VSIPGCSAECQATDINSKFYWQKQYVTASITAATLIYIIDERTNTTRTETKFNDLPSGITLPPHNAAGTQTATIEIETAKGRTSTMTLTYPTEHLQYPLSYNWKGTLPTVNALGDPVCSTAPPEGVNIDYSSYVTPAQPRTATIDPEDPKGYIYSLMGFGCISPADASINPNDAAPVLCPASSVCGVSAQETVQFLTATSVSRESTTPTPNNPNPNPNPNPVPQDPAPQVPGNQNPTPNQPGQNTQPTPGNAGGGGGGGGGNNGQQQQAPTPTPAPIVVGTQTFVANSQSNFVIGSQTLSQGGQIVAGGNTISLAQGGSIAVVNGATQSLRPTVGSPAAPAITVNGQTITANAGGQFVVGSSTLAVGGSAITVGGTTVRLTTDARGQTVALVNGRSSTLAPGSTGAIGDAVASGIGVQQFEGAGVHNSGAWCAAAASIAVALVWSFM